MSRIPDPIVTIGRNRSGMDAGEIDMAVRVQLVADLSLPDFMELLSTLEAAKKSCQDWYAKHCKETAAT